MPETLAHRRTAVARASLRSQRNPDDSTALSDLDLKRAELAEAKIADYIARAVAAAPALSPEQRSRLAVLLAPIEAEAA